MNKTIIININGSVFHIEEDAYEALQAYMTEVKKHFAYSADSDEIVTDIENRLSEMLSEKLQQQNTQVIILADVNEVTARMGDARQFDGETEGQEGQASSTYSKQERKLYRDPDERVVGGVCAGLAQYFNTEIRWVRLLSFIFVLLWGTGLIVYILLWIVIPEARTRAEKMAMKGEPANLQNFKRNFDHEMETLRPGIDKASNLIGDLVKYLVSFLSKAGAFLAKILGVLLMVFLSLILVSLLILAFGTLGLSDAYFNHEPFNAINPELRAPLIIGGFLVLFIPFLALLIFVIKLLFNRKTNTRYLSLSMLVLWIGGVVACAYYGTKLGAEFSQDAKLEETVILKPQDEIFLRRIDSKYLTKEDSTRFKIERNGARILQDEHSEGYNISDEISLSIEKSEDGRITLRREVSSRGRNFETALANARSVRYQFSQQDSILSLADCFAIGQNALYRSQRVNLTLRVPENTRLVIDNDMRRMIYNFDWDACQDNVQNRSHWIMTAEGMKCDSLFLPEPPPVPEDIR